MAERTCDVCGKPLTAGMTDGGGFFYCCPECFPKYMDDTFGKDDWKATEDDDDDGCGGYYVVKADDGRWEGTGIFYTEWED